MFNNMIQDDAEDTDIYSDLPTVNYSDTVKQLESSNRELLKRVKNLESQLAVSVKEKKELETQCQTLSFNISSLFKTAKAEIERKNNAISDLRSEINDVLFRRKKMGNVWSFGKTQEEPKIPSAKGLSSQSISKESKPRHHDRSPKINGRNREESSRKEKDNEKKLIEQKNQKNRFSHSNSKKDDKKVLNSTNQSSSELEKATSKGRIGNNIDVQCNKDAEQGIKKIKGTPSKDRYQRRTPLEPTRRSSRTTRYQSTPSKCNILDNNVENKLDCQHDMVSNAVDQDENPPKSYHNSETLPEDNHPTTKNHLIESKTSTNSIEGIAKIDTNLSQKEDISIRTDPIILTEYSKRMLKKLKEVGSTDESTKTSLLKPDDGTQNAEISSVNVVLGNAMDSKVKVSLNQELSSNPNQGKDLKESEASQPLKKDSTKTNHIVLPEKFSAISENFIVSMDLSISSNSNSDAGELYSSKTDLTTSPLIRNEILLVKDQGQASCELQSSMEDSKVNVCPSSILNPLVCESADNLNVVFSTIMNVNQNPLPQEKDNKTILDNSASTESDGIRGTALEAPCTDGLLCNSTSLQDILNISGEKNKIVNVSYELFSLESIDTFSVSPKKPISSEVMSNELNKKAIFQTENEVTKDVNHLHSSSALKLKEDLNPGSNELHTDVNIKSKIEKLESSRIDIAPACTSSRKIIPIQIMPDQLEPGAKELLEVEKSCKIEPNKFQNPAEPLKKDAAPVDNTSKKPPLPNVSLRKRVNKNNSKMFINPISNVWAKCNKNMSNPRLQENEIIKRIPPQPTCSEPVSDIVQSLFGSPVKWADSDSLDFIPPDIEKDPSAFEDSRSASEGPKTKLKPIEESFGIPIKPVLINNSGDINCLFPLAPKTRINVESENILNAVSNPLKRVNSKNGKISLSTNKCVQYEDTTLGQFEDTLQFVSALSIAKKTVSPISTPEKLDTSSAPSSQSNQPFSSVKINQKPGFKIVGPNEKAINILTPRKTPRVVSPKKLNTSNSSPNSTEKSSRISCIDDKAIESVCNLVSSIKETNRRETYLIIPKKSKINKNNSPKKSADSADNDINKTIYNQLEENMSPNNISSNSEKKIEKKNVKTNISLSKLSPRENPSLKLKSTTNSFANKMQQNKIHGRIVSKDGPNSLGKNEGSYCKLIESLALIPKSNSCTKVKMSYELKKPSSMGRRKSNNEINNKQSDQCLSKIDHLETECTPDLEARSRKEKVGFSKMNALNIKEKEAKISEKNLSDPSELGESPVSVVATSESFVKYEASVKVNSKKETSCELENLACSEKPSVLPCLAREVNAEKPDSFKLVENESLKLEIKGSIKQSQTSKSGAISLTLNSKREYCREKASGKSFTPEDHQRNLPEPKRELNENNDGKNYKKAKDDSSKPNSKCSDKPNSYNVNTDLKNNKKVSSATLQSMSNINKNLPYKKSEVRSQNHLHCDKYSSKSRETSHSTSGCNLPKTRERKRSNSFSPEKERKSPYYKERYSSRANYYGRRGDYLYGELPYRKKLSERYSCYRRREPSVFNRRSRSPSRDTRSKKYSYKRLNNDNYGKHSSKKSHINTDTKYLVKDPESNVKDALMKSLRRSWGSSSVTSVSMSPRHKVNAHCSNEITYDRINGIICNNINWKLIELDCSSNYTKESLATGNGVAPLVLTPTVSPSTSSLSVLSPSRIVRKKREINFSSSDVKIERFSSSPKKTVFPGKPSTLKSSSSTQNQAAVVGLTNGNVSLKSTSFHDEHHNEKISESDKNTSLEKSKTSKNSAPSNCPDKFNKLKNTLTYRVPNFIQNSNCKDGKMVSVSRIENRLSGAFLSAPDTQDNAQQQQSDESDASQTSFTSDESWAPSKKKRKR